MFIMPSTLPSADNSSTTEYIFTNLVMLLEASFLYISLKQLKGNY